MANISRYVVFVMICLLVYGCEGEKLPDVTKKAKIQINVPAEPFPKTRTQLITFNLEQNRDIFYNFYNKAIRIGMCSPTKIDEREKAFEVMSVSFWGESVKHGRLTMHILRTESGTWITAGYGGVEIFDDPEGFPEYTYSKSALDKIKNWYEMNVPVEYQKIASSNSVEYRTEYHSKAWPGVEHLIIGKVVDFTIVDSNHTPITGEPDVTSHNIIVKRTIVPVNIIRTSLDKFPDDIENFMDFSSLSNLNSAKINNIQLFGLRGTFDDLQIIREQFIGHAEEIKTEEQLKKRLDNWPKVAPIESAVDTFYLNCGSYPKTLNDLIVCPKGYENKWTGPYITENQLFDPSGKMYICNPNGSVVEADNSNKNNNSR